MRVSRGSLVVGLTALVVGIVGVAQAPVAAGVVERGRYAGTDSFSYGDCGYPVDVRVEFSGHYRIRAGNKGEQSAFFLLDNYAYREVHTRRDTGEWFVVRANGVINEVAATRLEDSIFEFVTLQAGQPFVVEDAAGNVVLRDRGAIHFREVIDTGGDDVPGGTPIEFLGAEVRGPHPGFFTDFCKIAGDLVGTGSAQGLTPWPAGSTSAPLGYYEYLPPDYGDGAPSPLLVFLHGFGESGDGSAADLEHLLVTGIPGLIGNNGWPLDRPFVVLAPQHAFPDDVAPYAPCDGLFQGGSCAMTVQHDLGHPVDSSICMTPAEVRAFLTYAIANYDIDPDRVYLTGLSCGAFGAWEYVAQYGGDQIAAMVPIAGEGRPAWGQSMCGLGEVGIWAFHGDADDVVAPAGSSEPITNLSACPSARDTDLTVYPGVDHDSWTRTYSLSAGHDIYAWLLGFTVT